MVKPAFTAASGRWSSNDKPCRWAVQIPMRSHARPDFRRTRRYPPPSQGPSVNEGGRCDRRGLRSPLQPIRAEGRRETRQAMVATMDAALASSHRFGSSNSLQDPAGCQSDGSAPSSHFEPFDAKPPAIAGRRHSQRLARATLRKPVRAITVLAIEHRARLGAVRADDLKAGAPRHLPSMRRYGHPRGPHRLRMRREKKGLPSLGMI